MRANGLEEGDFIVIYSDVKCGKYVGHLSFCTRASFHTFLNLRRFAWIQFILRTKLNLTDLTYARVLLFR